MLFTNPITNPLAVPVLMLLAALFGGAGALLAMLTYVQRCTPICFIAPGFAASPLPGICWQRYRTWLVIAILFGGAVLCGTLPLLVLCAALCWLGGREYAALTGLSRTWQSLMIAGGWVTLALTLCFGDAVLMIAPVVAVFASFGLALLLPGASQAPQHFRTILGALWGYFYIGWLPAHLLALDSRYVPGLVVLVGVGVALSDIGAFCAGKLIGGPALAPHLSPNKTWGGVVGNLCGTVLAVALVAGMLPPMTVLQKLVLVAAIGLGSVWGDLVESLLKRQRGVKDAGALLPGFGGVLDRADSLLIVAPLVFYSVMAFSW